MAATRKQHSTKSPSAKAKAKQAKQTKQARQGKQTRQGEQTTQHDSAARPKAGVLYMAFELSCGQWKLAFATGPADNPRLKSIDARDTKALLQEIAKAKKRFALPDDARVCTCYEAGRDGFWLHRFLESKGIDNQVVDSSSIEVKRQGRRRKTDRLDAGKLLSMLIRWHGGERKVWSVVQVPSVTDEDRRQLHRDLLEMKAQRTQHSNRIKGLLAPCGLAVENIGADFVDVLGKLRTWDGQAVPPELQQRLRREHERWQFVDRQIRDLENERARTIRTSKEPVVGKVRQLLRLRGIGANSAWMFVMECFGWRRIRNRKQLAALMGLTPTPYQSGDDHHEQGISKAGNRRMRTMAVEIGWCWLQYQPKSDLSKWYGKRFAKGSSRQRRIGIVALARKLVIALWRFLETGEVPGGAEITTGKKGLLMGDQEEVPETVPARGQRTA